jgi:hypothetical protein
MSVGAGLKHAPQRYSVAVAQSLRLVVPRTR